MREILHIDSYLYRETGGKVIDKVSHPQFTDEKIAVESGDSIYLSANYLIPKNEKKNSPVVVYIHERGKANGADKIAELLDQGLRVFALDPRGFRETTDPHPGEEIVEAINDPQAEVTKFDLLYGDKEDASFNAYCYQLKESLFGMRVADIINGVQYLKSRSDSQGRDIILCGVGDGALLAAHAAFLDKSVVGLVADRMLLSFEELATADFYNHSPYLFVDNVLSGYDTDDIISGLSGKKVILANTVNSLRQTMETDRVEAEFSGAIDMSERSSLWIGQTDWNKIAEMIAGM